MIKVPWWVNIVAAEQCNFNCIGCCHGCEGVKPQEHKAEDYIGHMEKLASFARPQFFHVTGGEPFLHSDILGFLTTIKENMPWDIPLVVFTNAAWVKSKGDDKEFIEAIARVIDRMDVTIHPEMYKLYNSQEEVAHALGRLGPLVPKINCISRPYFFAPAFTLEPCVDNSCCTLTNCRHMDVDGGLHTCFFSRFLDRYHTMPNRMKEECKKHVINVADLTEETFNTWNKAIPSYCRWCLYTRTQVPHTLWRVKV